MKQQANAISIGPFAELILLRSILAPTPDIELVAQLARALFNQEGSLARAMHAAIYQAPSVPGAKGNGYLDVVDLLWRMGVELPSNSVWLAYADQLDCERANPRAQEITRLLVQKGEAGLADLTKVVECWPELYSHHAEFIASLASK